LFQGMMDSDAEIEDSGRCACRRFLGHDDGRDE
jgi:hypothetical protein